MHIIDPSGAVRECLFLLVHDAPRQMEMPPRHIFAHLERKQSMSCESCPGSGSFPVDVIHAPPVHFIGRTSHHALPEFYKLSKCDFPTRRESHTRG